MTEPLEHSDYDSPWKEILEMYFEEFLAFFFPVIHQKIDWEKGYEFLDKELQKVVRLFKERHFGIGSIYRLDYGFAGRIGTTL